MKYKNLYLRKGVWWYRIMYKGKIVRRSTGTGNIKLAQMKLGETRRDMERGDFGLNREGDRKTFKELMDKYMLECSSKKAWRSTIRDNSSLKHLLPVFGNVYLSQITPGLISKYKTQRSQEGASPVSVNHELTLAKHAFNLAIKEWEWLRENPFARVSMEKVKTL